MTVKEAARGEKHAKAFVAALAPVLLLDTDAAAMQELWELRGVGYLF